MQFLLLRCFTWGASLTSIFLMMTACVGHDHEEAEQPASGEAHAGEIFMEAEAARAAGVRTTVVAPAPFRDVLTVAGRLMAAPDDVEVLVAPQAGRVDFLLPACLLPGGRVKARQDLMRISAGGMVEGDPALKAQAEWEAARAAYERVSRLATDRLATQAEVEAARLRLQQAEAACLPGMEATTGTWTPQAGISVAASQAGEVVRLWVTAGQYVEAGAPLLTVSRGHRLVLQADVPRRYVASLDGLTSADFRLAASDRIWRLDSLGGQLVACATAFDGTSPYLPVTFALPASEGLVPGSWATVWLLGAWRESVLSLPVGALTEEQGHYFVYEQLDADTYRKCEVELGARMADRVEVVHGLSGGERIVTEGAYRVRMAASSGIVPEGHHH